MTTSPPASLSMPVERRPWRLAELEAALAARSYEDTALVVLSAAAPLVPSERLLDVSDQEAALFWAEPGGAEYFGLGAAVDLRAHGGERFEHIRRQAELVFQRLHAPLLLGAPLRFFGGFAFQVGRAQGPLWAEFGDARFVLPRLTYRRDGQSATLSLLVRGSELTGPAERAKQLTALDQWLERLDGLRTSAPPATALRTANAAYGAEPEVDAFAARDEAARPKWNDQVNAARAAIAQGRFSKVVVARRAVTETKPPQASVLLQRLHEEAQGCTRFAFRHGNKTFVGATPERLVRRSGRSVETEALAGSIRSEGRSSIDELLHSAKDLREHAIVVQALLRALEPECVELRIAAKPGVRELRHVTHLCTPVSGQLRADQHVLELTEKLHPTPAVGGEPTAAALDWIQNHESDERGWYAAPVGWFDAQGNGDFAVALRSALLEPERAHLYVGSGIVSDSNADGEFAETRLKLKTIARALGARI